MAKAPTRGLTVTVKIDGLTEKLAEFKRLGDKKAIGEGYLRAASFTIANDMVRWTQSAAAHEGRQAAKLSRGVKVRRDRVPVVAVSPTGKLWKGEKDGSQREGWRALAGGEFGGRGHGFLPYVPAAGGRGGAGHWFYPTAAAHQAEVAARWLDAANAIIDAVNDGTL